MERLLTFLILFLLLTSQNIISQNDGWLPTEDPILEGKVWKIDGKIKYHVDSTMQISQRNEIICKTKEYIEDNLKFINESNFDDSVYILIARDRNEIKKYCGYTFSGFFMMKNDLVPVNQVLAVYKNGHSPLKHELMHLVSSNKWGNSSSSKLRWLREGLAMLADPDMDNCEGSTFEEKYVYFLQTKQLFSPEDFMLPFGDHKMPQVKIIYAQSAYIVEYLIKNYGMGKIKELWQNPMNDIEEVFGLTFDELIMKMNTELNEKYPDPIDFHWEKFNQRYF